MSTPGEGNDATPRVVLRQYLSADPPDGWHLLDNMDADDLRDLAGEAIRRLQALEHPDIIEAMELSGKLAGLLHRMCGDTADGVNDWAEIAFIIHELQSRILAQVAARAMPDRYRRLGGRIG